MALRVRLPSHCIDRTDATAPRYFKVISAKVSSRIVPPCQLGSTPRASCAAESTANLKAAYRHVAFAAHSTAGLLLLMTQ